MKVNKVKRAIIAAFAAVFAFVAPAVAANVAKIGDVEYATIDAAVAAWKPGEMIELLTDIERDSYFVFTQNTYALDGKGHTIKCTKAHSKSWRYFVNANAGTQTFKNIIIDGNGKVPYVMQAIDGGKLILENVTIKGAKTTTTGSLFSRSTALGYGIHVNDGSVEAKNITITNCEVADVYQDGASSSFTLSGDNCNVNFIGSSSEKESVTSTAKGYYAYEVTYKSNVGNGTAKTISNKSLNGIIDQVQKSITTIVATLPISVEIKAATVKLLQDVVLAETFTSNDTKLTINGNGKTIIGTFKFSSTPSPISSAVIGNGSVLDCTASINTGFSGVSVAANTTIDILLPASTDMNSYALPVALATDAVANIFVGDKKYIAKNGVISPAEKLAQIGDKQYATLQEAIDAANGAVIQVLKDVALTSSLNVPAGKTLTLNLAGRKVTISGADYALVNNGNLTIVDMGFVTVVAAESTIGDETTAPILIMAPFANDGVAVIDDATGGSIAGVQNNGTFALESGAVVAASASVPAIDNTANAVATITGGSVAGKLQSTDKTALTITGGSFTGESNVSEFVGGDYGVDSNGTIVKNVAKIGEVGYLTLYDAVKASTVNDTITLLQDVELAFIDNPMYNEFNAKELDLNGKTLTIKEGDIRFSTITIKNGNIVVDNSVNYSGTGVFLMYGDKTLTIEGVKITASGMIGTALIALENATNLTLKDSEILVNNASSVNLTAVVNNYSTGSVVIDNTKVTINNINGRGFLGGNYSVKNGSVIVASGVKAGFYIRANQSLSIEDTSSVTVSDLIDGKTDGIFLADETASYTKADTATVNSTVTEFAPPAVAKIGDTSYATLEEAFAAAQDGQTIMLLQDATPALTSQRAITKAAVIDLNGKALTLTEDDLYFGTTTFKNGTIVVDPSVKPSTAVFWMFANQTLTFDNVKVVATGVAGTYLIGLDGNNSDLNLLNGSEILVENTTALDLDIVCVNASTGNDIVIDNSKINVANLDGRVLFRGNYTISGTSEINLEGITKAGIRIEADQTLSIEDTASVTIAGELRDGGIHLTDYTSTYTKADTATVNATVNKPAVAKIGETDYDTIAEALAAAKSGDTIELLTDVTVEGTAQLPAGITIKSNGKKINGSIRMLGDLTLDGPLTITGGLWVGKSGETLTATLSGAKLIASYFMFQHGTYTINADIDAVYGYLSYNGTFEVNSKIHTTGANGEPLWVRGKVTLNNKAVLDSDKGVFLDNDNAVLTLKAGSTVDSNVNIITSGAKVYIDATGMTAGATANITGTVTNSGNGTVAVVNSDMFVAQIVNGKIVLVEYVAKIGEQKYTSLQSAVDVAVEGDMITLLSDVEQPDGVIIKDKKLTVNLNGKTFTVSNGASTNNRNFKINGTSEVVISNGTMVAAGNYSSGAYGTVRTEGAAKVELQDLKLYNYRGNGLNVKVLGGTTVTMTDVEIYSQYGGGVESAGGTVELTDVVVQQKGMYTAPYNSMAISVNGGGMVTVQSGTYSTECLTAEEANNQGTSHGPWVAGVLNSGGTLIINGGTFSNDNFGDNSLATYARGAILADTAANIQINGGTFNALKAIIDITNNLGDASKNPSATLKGGTFSADPRVSGLYASHLIKVAEGYVVIENNGVYTVAKAVAKIGADYYTNLVDAFKAATEGCTIEILDNVTIDYKWDCRDYATGGSHSQFKEAVTINGNGHTLKFTGTVNDNNWNTIFRFEENATVNNLTVDISEATGAQRVISAKKSLTVDGLTIIGSARYGVIFGEGASAADLAASEIVVTNSTLTGARRAISDNERGEDVKSVVITGNTLNANVAVSASQSITFNNNTAKGEVDLRSYSANNVLSVEAKGNTLTEGVKNYIYAKNIDAQADFTAERVPTTVSTYEQLIAALAEDNAYVVLANDITATATQSSGYGKAGIVVDAGDVLDGNGKTLTINGANATWDCVIAMKGGEVKNLTIAGAMRGVFMPGANGDVVIDNCKFENVIYTFNSDAGSKDYTVTIKNTELNGWTSFSDVHKSVTFENCLFAKGNGYAYCRPYQATTFNKCSFSNDFAIDCSKANDNKLAFDDCTYNGQAITSENAFGLFGDGSKVLVNGASADYTRVAQVGTQFFADLQEAIKAAAPAGTVELLKDVTVEKWTMISESLTIGDGTVVTLDMNGLTIDGNGHTLTVNDVESANNGNHLFYDGDFNICDLTLNMGANVNGVGITSGTISNVNFNGGSSASAGAAIHVSDALVASTHAGNVTIEGCTFKNNGGAIYYETAQNGLVVNNNTFEIPSGANVILLRGTEQFTGNTVVSGRTVNVVSGSPVVTGNNFGDVRLKVYNDATATISNNTINNLVFDKRIPQNSTFSNNTLSDSAQAALDAMNFVAKVGDKYYTTISAAIADARAGETVQVFAGTYAVPAMKAGITIEGAVNADGTPAVLFEGTLSGTLEDLTMKNIHIRGGHAQRWAYAKGDLNFENVIFEATSVYALHFDGIAAGTNLKYKNCTIIGWAAMGGSPASCVFDGCTIKDNGTYGVIRTYFPATITDCTFDVAGANTTDAYQDGIHAVEGAVVTVTNCTNANGEMKDLVNVHANSVVTLDGVAIKNVAKIGTTYYTSIAAAINAAQAGDTVTILAGDYNQDISVNKAITVQGATDANGKNLVNITGRVSASTGATVKNLNVHNEKTGNYDCAIYVDGSNIVIDGCQMTGYNGMRNCYAKGDVAIKNSTINGSNFAVHFDGSNGGSLTIEKCNITGWVSYGGGIDQVTLKDSTFDAGSYAGQRSYADKLVVEGCKFKAGYKLDVAVKGSTVEVTGSQMADGSSIVEVFNKEDMLSNNVIIDGTPVTYVAKIGNTYYATLEEALANVATWTTIKLVADATLDYGAREAYGRDDTTDIIIDGQGFTLTLNQTNSDWSSIGMKKADGKLTLKNMTIEKTGYGDTSGSWNTHAIIFSSNVEMNKVTINNGIAVSNGATLNNVTINEANGYYGLWIEANEQTVTMNGGAINATNGGRGIKIADQYVDSPAAVNLTIDGTVFNTAKKAAVLVSSTAGANITASNVNITKVAEDAVNFAWVDDGWAAYYGEVAVNGGTLTLEPGTAFVASLSTGDKLNGYYKTLADAVAAAQAGDTITLLADVTASEVIQLNKSLTINGAGHKVTSSATRVFRVTTGGVEVTLNDVNMVSEAVRVGTNDIRGIAVDPSLSNVKLTLNNCSVDFTDDSATDWAYAVNVAGNGTGHTITINGGSYEGANVINVYGANNTVTVTGAELNSMYPNHDEYYGAGIWVQQNQGSSVEATGNTFNGANAVAFNLGTGTALTESNNIDNTTRCVAKIGDQYYTSLEAAFAAAKDGDEVTILIAGTYALSTSGKDITITGAVDGVVFDNIGEHNMGGASMTFNNVTFNYAMNSMYKGLQHSGNLVYNNCTINGQVFLYGDSETFNNCVFNQEDPNSYNVWTYSADPVAFKNCTFNCKGKSVLIYHENASVQNNVTVTDCDFIAYNAVAGKAAIEMDSSLTAGITLTIDAATTATGFGTGNVSGNSLWNNKKGANTDANNDITVVVDGQTVLAPRTFVAQIGTVKYFTLAEALAAAQNDAVVELLWADGDAPIAMNGSVYGKSVTITGTATVDWSKGWLFVGRGGEGDGTVIFDNAKLTSTEASLKNGSYGIHVSAPEKGSTTKCNGTVIIRNNSDIQLSYLANRHNVTVDNSRLYVEYGFWVGGRPSGETPDSQPGVANMELVNNSTVTVKNHNGMGVGHESIGNLMIEAGSTFEYLGDEGLMICNAASLVSAGNFFGKINAQENSNIQISGGVYTQNVNEWCVTGYAALPNLNDQYVVGVKPTATVNSFGATTVPAGEYGVWNGSSYTGTSTEDMPLSFVMQFLADQNEEDMKTSPFADWYGDFVITFTGIENGSFTADGCYLAGHYGDFGWVKVPVDGMIIENDARYPVMLGVGLGQKYDYICSSVEDFKCAMFLAPEIIEANPNLKVKLELAVVDNSQGSDSAASALVNNDKVFSVTEYEYGAEAFAPALPTATVTSIDAPEGTPLTFALNFKADDVTDAQLAYYRDWYADFVLTITGLPEEGVTFNTDGTADGYLAGQYDAWSENWVSVPFEDVTLRNGESIKIMEYAATLMGQSGLKLTYNDVYSFVKNFDCGVYFTPEFLAANPDMKVSLSLRMYKTGDATDEGVAIGEMEEFSAPTVVAKIGSTPYATLEAAIAAAGADDTVTILKNVGTDAAIQVAKKVTIDLNGKTIAATENDKVGDGVFCVVAGGDLTINDSVGTGVINGVGDNDYNIAIWANGGKVTINGGNFTNVGATDKSDPNAHFDLIYAKNGGEVIINGGSFECETPAFTLNSHDTYKGVITVNGGTFVGFDPRNNAAETAGTTFMAAGKYTFAEGGNYIVVMPEDYILNGAASDSATVGDVDSLLAGAVTVTKDGEKYVAIATYTFKVTVVDTVNPEKSSYELTGGKLRPGKTVAVKYIDLATGAESWVKPESDTVTFKLVIK